MKNEVMTYCTKNEKRTTRKGGAVSSLLIFISCFSLLVSQSLLSSCSSIDDDLSDCVPEDNQFELNYELRLVTNMTTELQTTLTTQTDITVATALRTYLSDIFSDYAHDVDLSFYDTVGDSTRLQHDEHIMDANQASYTLNLPMRQYMHLAAANVVNNPVVSLIADNRCHQSQLRQVAGDTISSHTTGVFTARQQMEVLEGVDQTFNVRLYMTNCSATLVVDTIGSGIRDMKVYTTGFATAFNMADSSYVYADRAPIVRTNAVSTQNTGCLTFCSVNFPSHDTRTTRTVIETTDPFVAPTADNSIWEYHVYTTLADGSVTETKLYMNTPLRAGQLRILKAKVQPDGSVGPTDHTVGVSVTLNWNTGGGYEPEL